MKIKKMLISGFRGIKTPLEINFIKDGNCTSVIIYGRNGTGKSSITDSWEWLLNDKIESLNKENISCADYPHKSCNGQDVYIDVTFFDGIEKTCRVTYDEKRCSMPIKTGEVNLLKQMNIYRNHLRFSDLQEFITKTKTEKYNYISKYFGLEEYRKLQPEIQKTISKIEGKSSTIKKSFDESEYSIKELLKLDNIDMAKIISSINDICSRNNITFIDNLKSLSIVERDLKFKIDNDKNAKFIGALILLKNRINSFQAVMGMYDECGRLASLYNEITEKEDNLSKLILSELYEKSIKLLDNIDMNRCPLCDQDFTGDLKKYIVDKFHQLRSLKGLKDSHDKIQQSINAEINKFIDFERYILMGLDEDVEKFVKRNVRIVEKASYNLDIMKKRISYDEISSQTNIDGIAKYSHYYDLFVKYKSKIASFLSNYIDNINASSGSKSLANDYTTIQNLKRHILNYSIYNKQFKYIEQTYNYYKLIHQHILKYVSSYINDTLNQIQDDVSIIYNYLEESNTHLKNPEVKLLEGADKAIELSIEFVGEKVYPAYKFMSESQVNSFGLAIFLAAVKYFNPQFKFVILDDVISSFDAQKRVRIPQLLSLELFQDFQFLIMTHDNILFDYIQRAFPTWQRYKFTNWDYITGPIYRLSSNYVEEIQRFIDDDEAINAGHSLGRYLEWVLGEINENIKCPIPYKIMNVYTLQELFDPFKSRLNKIIKKDKYVHILTKLLTDLDNVIFRNYCDHWKNEAAPINTEDVSSIFSKWLEIQSILFCNNCKSFVRLDITDSHIKCNCNQLDLKNDSYYETSDK